MKPDRIFLGPIVEQLDMRDECTSPVLGLIEGAIIMVAIEGPLAGRVVLDAISLLTTATKTPD